MKVTDQDKARLRPAAPNRARFPLLAAQAGPTLVLVLLAPVVPGIADFLGPGHADQARLVVTIPFFGLMAGSVLSGSAIAAFGLRRLILAGFALWAVSGGLGLAAQGLPVLLLAGALLGLAAALVTSGLIAMTAILLEGDRRTRLIGQQAVAGHIIGVTLALASAALASRFGWRTPFAGILVYGGVLFTLCATLLPHAAAPHTEAPLTTLPLIRRIWPLCLTGAGIFVLATNQSTFLPFLLDEGGLRSAALRSLVTVATPLAGMAGATIFSIAQVRVGDRPLIALAGCSAAAGWLAFWAWPGGLVLAMAAAGLIGVGIGIVMPMLFNALLRTVPAGASGSAMGLLNATVFLGSFCSAPICTPLRAAAGLVGMMLWLGMATLGLTVVVIAVQRSSARSPGPG